MADQDHQSVPSRDRMFVKRGVPLPETIPYGPPQVLTGPGVDATGREINESLAKQGGLPGVVPAFIHQTTGVPMALPGAVFPPVTDPSPGTADTTT